MQSPESEDAISSIRQEWPNFRAVVEQAVAENQPGSAEEVLRGLAMYLFCCPVDEAAEWGARIADLPGSSGTGPATAACVVGLRGDYQEALEWCEAARIAGASAGVDRWMEAMARQSAYYYTGRIELARVARDDARHAAEEAGLLAMRSIVEGVEVYGCLGSGDSDGALDSARSALRWSQQSGDVCSRAWAELGYGSALAVDGDDTAELHFAAAHDLTTRFELGHFQHMVPFMHAIWTRTDAAGRLRNFQEAVRQLDSARNVAQNLDAALHHLAVEAARAGRSADAAPLLGYAQAMGHSVGVLGGRVERAIKRLLDDDPELTRLVSVGTGMSRTDAVAHALAIRLA